MARLTDRSIEALRPRAARYEIWDDARKGFGVRVSPRGGKSFVWVYHHEGRPRRLTFGTYPRLSLADAGVKLAEAKNLLAKGIDPGSRAVAERDAERHAETINELVASYLDRYAGSGSAALPRTSASCERTCCPAGPGGRPRTSRGAISSGC